MQNKLRDPIIYHGICNPKGEESAKTTFYTQSQLQKLQHCMSGTPIKILHLHQNYPNAGTILHGKVHPETGDLHTFFFLNDTPSGKVAQKLTGEIPGLPKEKQMSELSMGFSVMFDKNDQPIKNKLNEVSLCWEGDRKGTKILNKIPLSHIAKKIKENKGGKASHTPSPTLNAGPYLKNI